MFCCMNTVSRRSIRIEVETHKLNKVEGNVQKLLLLGTGDSGKSTLLKQLVTVYGEGYRPEVLAKYKEAVRSTVLHSVHDLIDACASLDAAFDTRIRPDAVDSAAFLKSVEKSTPLTVKFGEHVAKLWADEGVQHAYANRTKFQLNDSTAYFLSDRIRDIVTDDYMPNEQDALRSRVATSGIVEYVFKVNSTKFKMIDVGGQRNERKKWMHVFDNVTAVLFVVSLSEYDQFLHEDANMNRMTEALALFDEIVNSPYFVKQEFMLFLNKKDLLAEKIERSPLKNLFPEYTGGSDVDEAIKFIENQFTRKRKNPEITIYPFVTCATETTNVRAAFDTMTRIVIKNALHEEGLL